MLVARTTRKTGDDLLIIGLSRENRRRLDLGRPICVSTYTLGGGTLQQLHIVIFTGETEETMEGELAELIGSDTVVERWPRQKSEVQ